MAFATDSATPDTLDIECQIFWMLLKRLKFHPTSLQLGLVPQIYIRVSIARFTLQKWPSLLKACLLRATSVSPVQNFAQNVSDVCFDNEKCYINSKDEVTLHHLATWLLDGLFWPWLLKGSYWKIKAAETDQVGKVGPLKFFTLLKVELSEENVKLKFDFIEHMFFESDPESIRDQVIRQSRSLHDPAPVPSSKDDPWSEISVHNPGRWSWMTLAQWKDSKGLKTFNGRPWL
ncbi:MAG: hypothetical protein MMC33_009842 [Icmadophila ericetorum]|nr:hypothetical protein [Icmadophila ericetorum]